ncbi:hypothetical protein KR018_007902, partial [Drosophila ironensis]
IVEILHLRNQLMLLQATDPENRLRTVIKYAWHRQSQYILDRSTLKDSPELHNEFLGSICSTVTELKLSFVSIYQLKLWCQYTFPALRKLHYVTLGYDNDRNTALLVVCFPHLESFKVDGRSCGQHISRLRHLRRLDLRKCTDLTIHSFAEICRNLPLQSLRVCFNPSRQVHPYVQSMVLLKELEELEVNFGDLDPNSIRLVLGLQKLRRIRMTNFRYMGDDPNLIQLRGRDVLSATCNGDIMIGNPSDMIKMKNLRSLTIVNYDFDEMYNVFPWLEELQLYNSCVLPNANAIWGIVEACPSLKILTISNVTFHEEYFVDSSSIMKLVLDSRM